MQVALTAAAQGRTTVIVAHRLSTIRNAQHIAVIQVPPPPPPPPLPLPPAAPSARWSLLQVRPPTGGTRAAVGPDSTRSRETRSACWHWHDRTAGHSSVGTIGGLQKPLSSLGRSMRWQSIGGLVAVWAVRAGWWARQDGAILEAGTHQELMGRPGGAYVALVRHQQSK